MATGQLLTDMAKVLNLITMCLIRCPGLGSWVVSSNQSHT